MNLKNLTTSQGDLMSFKVALCVGFIEKFKKDLYENNEAEEVNPCIMKSHQLFEKAASQQLACDPITRPLPHITAAEHCSGEAVYIDDIPMFENELVLLPVQSKVAHGKIKKIFTDRALSFP